MNDGLEHRIYMRPIKQIEIYVRHVSVRQIFIMKLVINEARTCTTRWDALHAERIFPWMLFFMIGAREIFYHW